MSMSHDQSVDTCAWSGRELWEKAIAHTRTRSPSSFDQWFAGIQFDDLTDGVLSLRARDEFVLEWVRDHFVPTIAQAIRDVTGWSVQVAWSIDPDLTSPVCERPRRRRCVRAPSRCAHLRPAGSGHSSNRRLRRLAPAPDGMNPKHTFANFVVGPSNQLAHAAAIAAAGGGGRRYNPLFICGGTGLGKTHLVHAIAHRVHDERPDARIIYVSAERFTNDFIRSLQHHKMDEFRARYRTNAICCSVDDIQSLAGREQTQEEFFHTFNALHASDRQIVVTSDNYPQELERMEERLVSRFTWGLVADIQMPGARDARRDRAQEGAARGHRSRRRRGGLPRAEHPVERPRARGHAHPPRGQVRRSPASVVDLEFAKAEIAAVSPARAQVIERRGHPARGLPPLPPALERPAVEGPAQERRVRAARRDVPLQVAAASAASPSSGARSAIAITRP